MEATSSALEGRSGFEEACSQMAAYDCALRCLLPFFCITFLAYTWPLSILLPAGTNEILNSACTYWLIASRIPRSKLKCIARSCSWMRY